jgi:CRP-like cAMP-binding protein
MRPLHEHPEVVSAGRTLEHPAGAALFQVGDVVEAVHIVRRGAVFVGSISLDGDPAVIDVRGRGDVLDDSALLDERPELHYDTATAITDVQLWQVPLRVFDDLRDRSPEIGAALVAQLTEQVRRLSDALVDLHVRHAKNRTARRLLTIAETLARSDMDDVPVTATQQHLADYVGTTRSTLNSCLQELEGASAVASRRGRVVITSVPVLRRFA